LGKIFAERLKSARRQKGWTQKELASQLHVKIGTVSGWERSYREPATFGQVKKIADILEVSTDYLFGKTDIPQQIKIPLIGTIRAGLPLLAYDNWEGEIEIPKNLHADFALRITGDSMSWVGIHEGDIAILKKTDSPAHGMIVAAGIEEMVWSATLKFFIEGNGQPSLRSANPNYKDISLSPDHRIIGQVIRIYKDPPSLQAYNNLLIIKENADSKWQGAIQKAASLGLDGEKVEQLIALFSKLPHQI
jgi:repressor LexA